MNFNLIKAEFAKQGKRFNAVAKKQAVSTVIINIVCNRTGKSRRVAQAIADELNLPLIKVFPEYKQAKK